MPYVGKKATNAVDVAESQSLTVDGDFTVDTNTLKVDSTNNRVGIGKNPDTKLDVSSSGTSSETIAQFGNGNITGGLQIQTNGNLEWGFNALNSRNLTLSTNQTERCRLDTSGRLLVGKTTNSIGTVGHTIQGDGFLSATRDGGHCAGFNRLSDDGNVVEIRKDGTLVGAISVSGSATAYATSSDYRLKENVTDITGAIDRVKTLAPKRFNFKVDPDNKVDGFLAHEAQEVVPEAVTGTKDQTEVIGDLKDADGNVVESKVVKPETLEDGYIWTETGTRPVYQGIDQAKLVPVLTAALQEAIAKIETLETKVAALEAE